MARLWLWVLLSLIGALVGMLVGYDSGIRGSEYEGGAAFGDGLRGAIIGGSVGLGLGFLVGALVTRTRPGR